MTSQIVLGNGFGLTIASDTAVTTGGGGGERRTYETAQKIFPLSLPHRVAVLVSGASLLHGLPFDVLLKEWISSLGTVRESQLRSIELYSESFLSWLRDNLERWVTADRQEEEAFFYLDQQLYLCRQQIDRAISETPDQDPAEVTLESLQKMNNTFDNSPPLLNTEEADQIFNVLKEPIQDRRGGLTDLISYHFTDISKSEEIDREIELFLKGTIAKSSHFPRPGTELAFVGYGSVDLLPSVITLSIRGSWEKTILIEHPPFIEETRRDGSGYGLIYTQAQDDQIRLILLGYDPDLNAQLTEAVLDRYSVDPWIENSGSENDPQDHSPFDKAAFLRTMQEEQQQISWREKLGPARSIVAILPLETLVSTAQSLVSVQTLSQTIRGKLPTVGGKIEAATITLNEGFQWRTPGKIPTPEI